LGTEECFYGSSIPEWCWNGITLWLTVRNRSVVLKIASMTYYYGLIRTGGLFVKAS
jgi:hypothetical protein